MGKLNGSAIPPSTEELHDYFNDANNRRIRQPNIDKSQQWIRNRNQILFYDR